MNTMNGTTVEFQHRSSRSSLKSPASCSDNDENSCHPKGVSRLPQQHQQQIQVQVQQGSSSQQEQEQRNRRRSQQQEQRDRLEAKSDVLYMMHQQELNYYGATWQHEYHRLDIEWTPVMMQWMYHVLDIFELDPIVISTALWYLSQPSVLNLACTHSDYQLLGLTCLQLAIKVQDTKIFPMDDLVQMGGSSFTVAQVEKMEKHMLDALQWKLHPPTPDCFIHEWLDLLTLLPASASSSQHNYWKQHLTLIAQGHIRKGMMLMLGNHQRRTTSRYFIKPSVLAYASLLQALEELSLPHAQKQKLCWQICQVSGLDATTPGLAETYRALSTPTPSATHSCSTARTTTTSTSLRPDVDSNYASYSSFSSSEEEEEEELAAAGIVLEDDHEDDEEDIATHQNHAYEEEDSEIVPLSPTTLQPAASTASSSTQESVEVIFAAVDGIEVTWSQCSSDADQANNPAAEPKQPTWWTSSTSPRNVAII